MKKCNLHICKGIFLVLFMTFLCSSMAQNVRINEFMALNQSTVADEDGDFSDWIELYNPTSSSVNLQSWSLTDDATMPSKWQFPNVTINAGEYLVVFASSKDRKSTGSVLHTNFNLSGSGEYLALMNGAGTVVSEFSPAFPPQQTGFSYGFYNNAYVEFSTPTPGAENSTSAGMILPAPAFSKAHGFYESAFQLTLTTGITGGQIYYTTDGSFPTKTNGKLYTSAINITTTSIIRAVVIDGSKTGKTGTQTYLFLNDVIRQNNTPAGYPTAWGPYTAITGNAIADYEMDPEMMTDATFAANVKKGLAELPTISIVTDKANLFSTSTDPNTGGIYMYTGAPLTTTTYTTGRDWERPISFEYIGKDTTLQADCGLRIQGGHGRRPEKSAKHSFLLVFDSQYGPSKLNYPLIDKNGTQAFENIILRAGFGNTWIHQDGAARTKATYQEDIWTKDTQRAMGHPASNSVYAHLYINGMYWGIYAPSERMDKEFAESHMGGNEDDWDVIKDYAEVSDGNILAWNKLIAAVNAGVETNDAYLQIQGKNADGTPNYTNESLVDVVNLADYMLINFWGGNTDWDHHNWSAMRNRLNPEKGFKFFCWDAEIMFSSLTANILSENNANCPSNVYQQLLKNTEFKRLLADRIQLHCFNNGLLTPDSVAARWLKRKAQLENPIYAESARWGDYRRDVHVYSSAPYSLCTKETYWIPQENYILNTFIPQRTNNFITQLRAAGLFPSIDAPVFYINDKISYQKKITAGDKLKITATKGTVYFTSNGTDPLDHVTGNVSTKATQYTAPVTLSNSCQVVSRTLYNGEWSAANSRFFVVPTDFRDVKITEIHYHPLPEGLIDDSEFEFIELKNTGTSTLDMGGSKFISGVNYTFPQETKLGAGEFIVLASNSNDFFARYKFRPTDVYNGKLDNGGEWIKLLTAWNDTVASFHYSNVTNWPSTANGAGYSLVPVVYNPTNNQTLASDWRASTQIGGSPGADDILVAGFENQQVNPQSAELLQNFPNPFNTSTYIGYRLPENAKVQLSIYNLIGQQITTLISTTQNAGYHELEWNGCNELNQQMPDGIYFYRLQVQSDTEKSEITRKMILRR